MLVTPTPAVTPTPTPLPVELAVEQQGRQRSAEFLVNVFLGTVIAGVLILQFFRKPF